MKTFLKIIGFALIIAIFDISQIIKRLVVTTSKKEQLAQTEQDFFNLYNLRDKAKQGSAEWLRYTKALKHKIKIIRGLKEEMQLDQ